MRSAILILTMIACTHGFSQRISENLIAEYEDTLKQIAHVIMHGKSESERYHANKGFISELEEVIKYKESYKYPFDSLITISILSPEDKSWRIFNWILKKDNGEYQYFGIICLPAKETEKYNKLIYLKDNSDNIFNPEKEILNQDNWYGSLYYKIISLKRKENDHYTLLSWDGNNDESTKKIIEVIEIREDSIIFGKNIFDKDNETRTRVILEYNSNTSASLQYEKKRRKIVFDHLVPLKENQEGFDQFYVPDGTYDAYQYKNGRWKFQSDIDVRMQEK